MGGLRAWWRSRRRALTGRRLDPAVRAAVRAAYREGGPISESLARQAAESGDPEGMALYGIRLGSRGAYAEAAYWLERATEAGDTQAMVVLGTLHLDHGNLAEAERHFRRAAESGHAGAVLALGEMRARRNGSAP